MSVLRRRLLQSVGSGVALALAAQVGHAQTAWPKAKNVSIIVPFGAGGSLDATTRLLAQRLSERLGQNVVVENVTGAGGALGFQKAIAAAPDGYTFLIAGDSPLVAGQETRANPYRFDVRKELAPVVLVNTAPMVLVAHPSIAANNMAELASYARARPGQLSYGSPGVGTIPHLVMETIKREAQLHMVHIPYRGGAQIATDVAGKQIELAMMISSSAAAHVQSKVIKALAVTGDKRLPFMPQVPTLGETAGIAGLKGFNVESWSGIYAPAKTPPAIVQQMNHEVSEVLKLEAVRSRLAENGVITRGGDTAAFLAYIERDRAQTTHMLRNTRLDQ